jgi:hypothetical protein
MDNLVGEWLTSSSINGTEWNYGQLLQNASAKPAYGRGYFGGLGPGYRSSLVAGQEMEITNYVPRSVEMLNVTICGIPDPYRCGSDGSDGGRYGINRIKQPGVPYTWDGPAWAPYGISGAPLYTGGYWVQVDVVPFGNTYDAGSNMLAAGAPGGTWWPMVPGLLYGESVGIDPRTGKLYAWTNADEHTIWPNHIGPYQQRVHITLPGAHLGGEVSAILELDHLGLAQGIVYAYTWCDDWRSTSWVNVLFSGAPGALNYFTFDGTYQAYLPAGTWKMDVIPWLSGANSPGLAGQSFTLAVSDGQAGGYNVYLEQSGIPIPEFSTVLVVLASGFAAALSILRLCLD